MTGRFDRYARTAPTLDSPKARRDARIALAMHRPEKLAGLTAEDVARHYRLSPGVAGELLAEVRQERLRL